MSYNLEEFEFMNGNNYSHLMLFTASLKSGTNSYTAPLFSL